MCPWLSTVVALGTVESGEPHPHRVPKLCQQVTLVPGGAFAGGRAGGDVPCLCSPMFVLGRGHTRPLLGGMGGRGGGGGGAIQAE